MRASTRLALLEKSSGRKTRCRLRDCHPLRSVFPNGSATGLLCHSPGDPQSPTRLSRPPRRNACGLARRRFRLFRFRSPLLTKSMLSFHSWGYLDVSVPPVRFPCLWIQHGIPRHAPRWVVPLGDLGVHAWLAARPSFSQLPHVRLRFLAPKHPPRTLSSLTMFSLMVAVQRRSRKPYRPIGLLSQTLDQPLHLSKSSRLVAAATPRVDAHEEPDGRTACDSTVRTFTTIRDRGKEFNSRRDRVLIHPLGLAPRRASEVASYVVGFILAARATRRLSVIPLERR